MSIQPLDEGALTKALAELPGWQLRDGKLHRVWSISRINALSPSSLEYPPVGRQPSTCLRRDIGRNPSFPSREIIRRR